MTTGAVCERHSPSQFGANLAVVRCAHWSNRFVVEFRTSFQGWHFIDYVEDLPDDDVLMQANYVPMGKWDEVWSYLHGLMMAGVSFDPEATT